MRNSLWALLIVAALVLSACGPAMPSATGAKTESGEVFQLALPRLEIAFDAQGNPTVLGMKLSDVGAMLGQDLSTLKMDPALISWMTNANIQHIEMRQTGDSLALLINGKPMPHLAWDDKALSQAMDLAGGDAHEPAVVGQVRHDALANPPHGIGNQAEAARRVEACGGTHETDIALVDQVFQGDAMTGVLPCHGDDEAQVAPHQFLLGRGVPMTGTQGELPFLTGSQDRDVLDFLEVALQGALLHG